MERHIAAELVQVLDRLLAHQRVEGRHCAQDAVGELLVPKQEADGVGDMAQPGPSGGKLRLHALDGAVCRALCPGSLGRPAVVLVPMAREWRARASRRHRSHGKKRAYLRWLEPKWLRTPNLYAKTAN